MKVLSITHNHESAAGEYATRSIVSLNSITSEYFITRAFLFMDDGRVVELSEELERLRQEGAGI